MTASPLRRLLGQGSLYAIGNVAMKGAGFLLALWYLDPAYLAQSAYGVWGTLDAAVKVLVPFIGLGMTTGILRFWADPGFKMGRDDLAPTALVVTALMGVVVLVAFAGAGDAVASLLLGREAPPEAGRLMPLLGVLIAARALYTVPTALLRIRERADLYLAVVGAEMVLLVGATYYLLVVRGAGLEGVVLAHAGAAALSAGVLVAGMLASGRFRVRRDVMARLVRFGFPLAAAGAASLLLNLGDRFLLLRLVDADATAVYDWAGRLGSLLYLVVVSSFNAAFSVLGVKALRGDTSQTDVHRRVFRHFTVGTGWVALALSLVAYDLTRIVSPNSAFLEAETLVLPIVLGFLFYGVYFLLVNILYVGDKTRRVAANIFGATALNVGLNVVLIPWLGGLGAALATLLSYGALLAVTARAVQSESGTRFRWRVLAVVVALVVGLYAIGHAGVGLPPLARLGLRTALVAAYGPLAVLTGLYRWDEVREGLIRLRVAARGAPR